MRYVEGMTWRLLAPLLLLLATAAPAIAEDAATFLVNGTGVPLTGLVIRSYGHEPWRAVGSGSAVPGQGSRVALTPRECAYDVRAALPDGTAVTWVGVNLCETKRATLNRREDGTSWVDYD